jgi:hypothetical protein
MLEPLRGTDGREQSPFDTAAGDENDRTPAQGNELKPKTGSRPG